MLPNLRENATQPRGEFKIVPSDHYGLLVDLALADSL